MAKSSSKSESKIFPFSSQKSLIESQLSSVEKDNNFIYHAKVPETSGLANIERAPLAKPVTYGESPLSSDFSGILSLLIVFCDLPILLLLHLVILCTDRSNVDC